MMTIVIEVTDISQYNSVDIIEIIDIKKEGGRNDCPIK